MNATDPKVLDLWIAWLVYGSRQVDEKQPAAMAFQKRMAEQ